MGQTGDTPAEGVRREGAARLTALLGELAHDALAHGAVVGGPCGVHLLAARVRQSADGEWRRRREQGAA